MGAPVGNKNAAGPRDGGRKSAMRAAALKSGPKSNYDYKPGGKTLPTPHVSHGVDLRDSDWFRK